MTSNFCFLQEKFPVLADYGVKAEKYLYSDSNSCLMKLGMIGETIVNLMFKYDHLPYPYDNTAVTRIDTLYREGMIDSGIKDVLHALRKCRNKAVNENYSSIDDGKALLQMTFSLCVWFYQIYGDYEYIPVDFVMPQKELKVIPIKADLVIEEKEEEKLTKLAEEAASAAPAVDRKERKKKAAYASNQRPKSEAETRYLIDEQLRKVGWEADTNTLRYSKGTRPKKGHNIAIAEWPTDSTIGNQGRCDYILFIGEKMVATVEAKAMNKDISSVVDYQCKDYSRLIRSEDDKYRIGQWGEYKVPFTFATNGRPYLEQYKTMSGIWFHDLRDPSNAPMALRGWMSPIGMAELLKKDIEDGNRKLGEMPFDLLRDKNGLNLRDYQVEAIEAAEDAIFGGAKTALLAMATGTGKTRTVLGMIYRFLKTGRFHRILFLVDRNALGQQAEDVFNDVKLEDLMSLNQIYNIKGLGDQTIDKETRIQVATVQSMVRRILYNDGNTMPAVTDYDLIIVDEAHRGYILDKDMTESEALYTDQKDYQSKYRAVIDYFDAVKIGLTATPALQTTQIFGEPVYQYTYRQGVIDGYLVDHDAPHELKTKLGTEGIHYKKGDTVTIYDPVTNVVTDGALLDDEVLDFDLDSFNRQVITENFNRAVLTEIAKDVDPEAPDIQGKTLIFAANDQHADLVVKILKEIYSEQGVDTDAIMKITGSTGGGNPKKIEEAIKRFKNERFPSVVVTVDLLTTGIDVPAITTLVFLRRVKSRILFEQMLGRATRPCSEIHKRVFQIYDAVGVYDSLAPVTSMNPVVTNPSESMTQVLDRLEGAEDPKEIEYDVDQVLAKLQRKKRKLNKKALEQFSDMTDGKTPDQLIAEVEHAKPEEAKKRLLAYYQAIKYIQQVRIEGSNTVVISREEDELISHTRGYGKDEQRPEDYLDSFSSYVKNNRNEIAALNIVCTKPSDLTRKELKSLTLALDREGYTTQQLNTAVSQMTNQEMAADMISLIRRYAIGSPLISHEERIHKAVEKLVQNHDFNKTEINWLKRIEKYLIQESVINVSVFDEDSRFKAEGGYARINKIFQLQLKDYIRELNGYLYDDGGRSA
jgi:type I restriction enzyme R subunit